MYTPYRCLLPRRRDGMLVTGLGASAHRDAMALIRMQADLQNQGYAAGLAAAMAAEDGVQPRQIDVRRLQHELVRIGNLPQSVLSDGDSFPATSNEIASAVEGLKNSGPTSQNVALIFAHLEQALPLLKQAYHEAEGESCQLCDTAGNLW